MKILATILQSKTISHLQCASLLLRVDKRIKNYRSILNDKFLAIWICLKSILVLRRIW